LESDGESQKTPNLPSGDQSEVEPPGPIPNPEVKRLSADDSGTIGPVKVGRRQVLAPHFGNKVRGSFFYSLRLDASWSREVLVRSELTRMSRE
jgi:hypothetical protein